MITQFFLDTISAVIEFFIGLLPDPEALPDGLSSALSTFADSTHFLNHLFPMSTFLIVFSFVVAIELGLQAFNAYNWLYNKFRGSG